MSSKSLILFKSTSCRQMGQQQRKREESRACCTEAQFAHKDIHKICGQPEKHFSIIDLAACVDMKPSYRAQLGVRRL
jgi:hypothetical protein